MSGLVRLVLQLAVIGVIAWLLETYVPMSPPIKILVRVILVILVALFLLRLVNLL